MKRALVQAGLGVAALLVLFWLAGGLDGVERAAAAAQKSVQNGLAGAVRALRGGEAGALAWLLALCFAYGFVHAAGPGHGKFLIGGYGVARRVGFLPLAGIAVLTAMAQAAVAVVMVHAGLWALGWTREQMAGAAEGVMTVASYAAIAAIGLWLAWRGGRALRAGARGVHLRAGARGVHLRAGARRVHLRAGARGAHGHHIHDHDHDHDHHDHGPDCGCGHAHTPAPEDVAALTGWRDTLALVAGVAIRPCSGALFLLILTWQLGIAGAGIAGAFAMGLGVAVVTVAVAVLAVWSREGALAGLGEARVWRVLPVVEIAAGLGIATFAAGMVGVW